MNTIKWWHILLSLFGILLLGDLLFLNYRIFSSPSQLIPSPSPIGTISTPTSSLVPTVSTNQFVQKSELDSQLLEATSALTQRIAVLEKKPATQITTQTKTSNVKEYYIPLGSGSTTATDWVDIPGAEAYVAPSNYGSIKEMYFEVGIHIPTANGRIYARLKNVTDNVTLVESEVYQEGAATGITSSTKIPVPTSTKLYRVQLKSTLGYEGLLDMGRIKIFVN